ncbi:MAG: 6-bladed beta-propeller [Marinilabiliaceae bacterium]|nr:6-bladed beta-propeller [Marinilabiliaceae bacterium]
MKRTVFLVLSIFMVSCSTKQVPEVQQIEISYKMADGKIEDLIRNFELIQLDTCTEAHITYAEKIVYKDNMYFIKDENKVLIFNSNGAFLNIIERTGRGPDEYVYLSDFYYDDSSKEIILTARNLLFFFNLEGELKRTEKLEFGVDLIHKTNNGNFAFSRIFPSGEKNFDYNLILTNKNFEILEKKISLPLQSEKGGMLLGQSGRLRSNFGRDYFLSLFCDTVFLIDKDKIIPDIVFNFDKDVFSISGIGRELDRDKQYLHFDYAETEKNRILSFSFNWVNYLALINLNTGKTRIVESNPGFSVSNTDGNTFLMNMFPYLLEQYPELYDSGKCTNPDLFERLINYPEDIENIIVRVELDI